MRWHRVLFTPAAERELDALPSQVRQRLDKHILALADDPRPRGCKKLAGARNRYRIRVGDYRVLYAVQDDALVVLIVRVGHRGSVYLE
jgi:mRNA interferase RelE/StbE